MSENPYAPPSDDPLPAVQMPISPAQILGSFLTWTVICSISAIPSFVLGATVSEGRFKFAAMSLGIFLFAAAYTIAHVRYFRERLRRNPALRRTVFTGYTTRIIASIVFPVGAMIDMWFGIVSVAVGRSLGNVLSGARDDHAALTGFVEILAATLVQGCCLNLFLAGYMAVVYCIFVVLGTPTELALRSNPDPTPAAETTPVS